MNAEQGAHHAQARMTRHRYHSLWRRAGYSLALLAAVMSVGVAGMHAFERMSYLDAFYFMSMIATAQGPMVTPATTAGKLFTSFMAFLSVGSVVTALGFLFGPFLGQLFHLGARRVEDEVRRLERRDQA